MTTFARSLPMDALTDRAAHAVRRHPAAALPVSELARLVQDSGAPVPDHVLLQALVADRSRFRVLDPWKGPWTWLRVDRRIARLRGRRFRDRHLPGVVDGPRVIPEPGLPWWSPGPAGPALGRMRQTLIRLGWTVDESSSTDLARWYRLVLEGLRVRGRLTGGT